MSGIPAGAGSLIGKRLGKYNVLALLALGGTAEIYLARIDGTAGFEKYVVVKCLHDHLADDPDFVKMFLDEARLASALDHSNIVQTYELGEHEDRYYMVMEYLAGLSLAMVVRRAAERVPDGKLPVPLILNVAAQAASGLHYAHERTANGKPLNMVHRDISPQNLVIGFEGVLKVVDFGIARAELRETKTKAGTIKGKFAYMSPEQCVATNVDRRTDVFALGVIVHELLTGRRLFKRNSPYETYQAVLDCNVPIPSSINPEVDAALDEIVMKACARDKDARWPTAEAMGDALQAYLHQHAKSSAPSELAKFFDEHFQIEIEEHGERMRELIEGRADVVVDAWADEDDKKAKETLDLHGKSTESLDTADLAIDARSSNAQLDQLVARLGTDDGMSSDDGPPPDKTRIEQNPLELLNQLDANTTAKRPRQESVPPLPTPPPAGPVLKPSAPKLPITAKPGRFPDAAQLPTMISDPIPVTPPPGRSRSETKPDPAMAPTAAAIPLDPTVLPVGPHSATHAAVTPEEMEALAQTHVHPGRLDPEEMTVRPLRGTAPPPQPQQIPSSPYPVVSGRPFSTEIAPSLPPRGSHRNPHSAPHRIPNSGPHPSPSLMSPVGESYPAGVDWNAAAAKRARALAPWQLALLFVGALGLALLLTMMIAKIARC